MQESGIFESQFVKEYLQRCVWLKCQEIIQSDQLNSHARHEIFGHVVKTPNGITFISYNESLCENGMRKMKYKYIKTPLIV